MIAALLRPLASPGMLMMPLAGLVVAGVPIVRLFATVELSFVDIRRLIPRTAWLRASLAIDQLEQLLAAQRHELVATVVAEQDPQLAGVGGLERDALAGCRQRIPGTRRSGDVSSKLGRGRRQDRAGSQTGSPLRPAESGRELAAARRRSGAMKRRRDGLGGLR
jgi:hypothetical protein